MRPDARSMWWVAILVLVLTSATPWPVCAQGRQVQRAPAQATQPVVAETIRDIRISGNQRVDPSTIEAYLTAKRGEPADQTKLDQSLRALFATGLFADVAIERQGDVLLVRVVENPIINRVAFEGNQRIEDKDLEAEVQLRPRLVYTQQRVQEAVQRILELYRRQGRYSARVDPKVIELDQNRVDLVFEIEEGQVTKVSGITFIGNKAFSSGTLRGVIQTTESAWYKILTSDDAYDPDRVAFDQELLRRYYTARGYADFAVVSAVAELTPDGSGFYITFTLDEGPLYTFDVRSCFKSQIEQLENDTLVLVIPLLFEANLTNLVTEIWVVYCSKELQIKRLMERNNLTNEQAQARIKNQLPIEKKVALADVVLDNYLDLNNLFEQINKIMKVIQIKNE